MIEFNHLYSIKSNFKLPKLLIITIIIILIQNSKATNIEINLIDANTK